MKDNQFDRFVSNKRTGKLDTKKIYRIETTNKVFKKKEERKGKIYNITILIDASGSMSRGRIKPAIKAVDILAESINKVKLPFQILCFNSDLVPIKKFNERYDKNLLENIAVEESMGSRYKSRVKDKVLYSYHIHTKEYDKLSGYETYNPASGNFDGYFINKIVNDIKKLKGQNIVIVLSDGMPSHDFGDFKIPNTKKKYFADYPLEKVVSSAIRNDIIFLGIGIQTDVVKNYYPEKNTIVLNNLDNLYSETINKLNALIKRG